MIPPKVSFLRLTKADDVSAFYCGDEEWQIDIVDFLKDDALNDQERGLNVTLLYREDNHLIGYTSLVASNLYLKQHPDWLIKLGLSKDDNKYVPCVLVGRFGIDSRYQKQGKGQEMLSLVRGAVIGADIGVRLLTLHVDRRNKVGRKFWTEQGFTNFPPAGNSEYLFMVHNLFD